MNIPKYETMKPRLSQAAQANIKLATKLCNENGGRGEIDDELTFENAMKASEKELIHIHYIEIQIEKFYKYLIRIVKMGEKLSLSIAKDGYQK